MVDLAEHNLPGWKRSLIQVSLPDNGLFFFATGTMNELYGNSEMATDLSNLLFQFIAVPIFASGVMGLAGRSAAKSIGRTAIFYYLAVSMTLFFILNLMNVISGEYVGTMNYIDLVVQAFLGAGAILFIMKDRSSAE